MSTVIATYILGVATGPAPKHPLRTDYDMDLWETINSGLRLRIKTRKVYWEGPSCNFGSTPSLYGGSTAPKRDEISIVTLDDSVQIGMIKNPVAFYHTLPNTPPVPQTTIVSFVELLGPETSLIPTLSIQAVKALTSAASQSFAKHISKDKYAFYTLKDGDPFHSERSILLRPFERNWPVYQNILPPRRRNPLCGPARRPESSVRTALDTIITSRPISRNPYDALGPKFRDFDRSFCNRHNAAETPSRSNVRMQPIHGQPGCSIVELPPQSASRALQIPTPLEVIIMVVGTILAMELYRHF